VKRYKGDGPNTSTGLIEIISWVPHSGYDHTEIIEDLTMYMDATFKITNAVPENGTVTISLSNVDIQTPEWWLGSDQSSSLSTA